MPEMVDPEHLLESLAGLPAFVGDDPGVVDQNVDVIQPVEKFLST